METADLVHAIRDARPALEASTGTQLWVTGAAAANIDITEKLADAFPLFLLIVVGLAIVLLLVAFRSLLVPVTAVLGFLLTIAAAFGATTAVFQWGWLSAVFNVDSTGPLLSFLPILLVGVLFGLAMDYQVFLVSRMREEHVHGAAPTEAVRLGFAHGARVVAGRRAHHDLGVLRASCSAAPRRSARSRSRWPSASCSTRSSSA